MTGCVHNTVVMTNGKSCFEKRWFGCFLVFSIGNRKTQQPGLVPCIANTRFKGIYELSYIFFKPMCLKHLQPPFTNSKEIIQSGLVLIK